MTSDRTRKVDDMVQPEGGLRGGTIVALVALGLFILFVLQNLESGNVDFLWFDITLPIWVFVVIVFFLGLIVGYWAKGRRIRQKAQGR